MSDLRHRIERLFAAWGASPAGAHGASMNNLFYFGLLTGFTIIAAFLADLILAPALMALVIRPRGVEVVSALEMEVSR